MIDKFKDEVVYFVDYTDDLSRGLYKMKISGRNDDIVILKSVFRTQDGEFHYSQYLSTNANSQYLKGISVELGVIVEDYSELSVGDKVVLYHQEADQWWETTVSDVDSSNLSTDYVESMPWDGTYIVIRPVSDTDTSDNTDESTNDAESNGYFKALIDGRPAIANLDKMQYRLVSAIDGSYLEMSVEDLFTHPGTGHSTPLTESNKIVRLNVDAESIPNPAVPDPLKSALSSGGLDFTVQINSYPALNGTQYRRKVEVIEPPLSDHRYSHEKRAIILASSILAMAGLTPSETCLIDDVTTL